MVLYKFTYLLTYFTHNDNVPLLVLSQYGLFIRVKLIRVEHSQSLVQALVIQGPLIGKYLKFLEKVYSAIAGNVMPKSVFYLLTYFASFCSADIYGRST